MYNMARNTYECDYCGTEMRFDERDDIHGVLWGCEACETTWCTKCFIDRHGLTAYEKMLRENDRIYCPSCYEQHKEEFA